MGKIWEERWRLTVICKGKRFSQRRTRSAQRKRPKDDWLGKELTTSYSPYSE
jgi:hypothetical protein